MPFNADAYLKARTPWALVLGDRTYQAAWVSVDDVTAFLTAFQGNGTPPTPDGMARGTERLVRRMFPARLSYRWRDPVRLIMGLDVEARGAILADFFVWWKDQRSASSTNGTDSRSRTPPTMPTTGPVDPDSA